MAAPERHVLEPSPRPRAQRGRDVTLSVFLGLLLATTVMAWPLGDAGAYGLLAVLRVLTLLAGVAAIATSRGLAMGAAALALVVGVGQLVEGERGAIVLAARLAFYSVLGAALLARVFGRGRITVHRLLGALSVYVLLAVLWGTAYELIVVLRPGAFKGSSGPATLDEVMWLSFITITTTGYGDVLPASALARSLAALEAMVGVIFPAVFIARIVSLVQGPSRGDGSSTGGPLDR